MRKIKLRWCAILCVQVVSVLAMQDQDAGSPAAGEVWVQSCMCSPNKEVPIYACPYCFYHTESVTNFKNHSCEEVRQAIIDARESYRRCILREQSPANTHTGHYLRERRK